MLDSEDENGSLDPESQSPGRPNKKQKLQDESHDLAGDPSRSFGQADQRPNDITTDDGPFWLLSPVAKTYSRNMLVPLIPRHRPVLSPKESSSLDLNDSGDRVIPPRVTQTILKNPTASAQSTVSVDDLPEVGELWTRDDDNAHATLGSESPLSSVPSSPLSELDVSTLLEVDQNAVLRSRTTQHSPGRSGQRVSGEARSGSQTNMTDSPALARTFQRNLRARNERQLHPYMFDLAQYQQQFRERGLRPVRYVDTQQAVEESQDAFSAEVATGGQSQEPERSSPPPGLTSPQLHEGGLSRTHQHDNNDDNRQTFFDYSDDELPDVSKLIREDRIGALQQRGYKRRKLVHGTTSLKGGAPLISGNLEVEVGDVFSVPLSPPSTSSQPVPASESRPQSAGFRLPRGLTPAPLPTPQISLARRQDVGDDGDALSDADFDRSRMRISAKQRRFQPQVMTIDSSSESSESDLEQEVVERRLKRERKRIKGVLPASWLKIDFHAQRQVQASPIKDQPPSPTSPPTEGPKRGLAQRIAGRRTREDHGPIYISDDDDDNDATGRRYSPSPPSMRQPTLQFQRAVSSITAADDLVDDERMEFDWIDPGFASSSRVRTASSKLNRQPRITDAFNASYNRGQDFSEERRANKHATGRSTNRRKQSGKQGGGRQRRPAAHYQLSILDAPSQTAEQTRPLPSFVRLAMRAARQRPDQGRHSPSRKVIRLSTEEDTAEATSTLQAWREGTVVPRHQSSSEQRMRGHSAMTNGNDDIDMPETATRRPLTELSTNVHPFQRDQRYKNTSSTQPEPRTKSTFRRPRMQQTRLNPTMMINDALDVDGQQLEPEPTTITTGNVPTRKPMRDPPRGGHYRHAQLEALETTFDQQHRSAAFERRMQLLTESVARNHRPKPLGFQVARFLEDEDAAIDHANHDSVGSNRNDGGSKPLNMPQTTNKLPRRPRKHQARRIDAETMTYRQPSEPLPEIVDLTVSTDQQLLASESPTILHGLGPFGTRYATDFDVYPLALGTYFHESSFIGSGDFAASLRCVTRDFCIPAGRIRIHVDGDVLEWGPWTDDVNVGLTKVTKAISSILESSHADSVPLAASDDEEVILSNIDYLLRSTIRYITKCMVFLDPVDRVSCVQRLQTFISDLFESVAESTSKTTSNADVAAIRCTQYALVLSQQVTLLSDHSLLRADLQAQSNELLAKAGHQLLQLLFPRRMDELRTFLEDNKRAAKREAGIRDSDASVCSVVILHHVLGNASAGARPSFWEVVNLAMKADTNSMHSVSQLDHVWYSIFTLLPLLEIDIQGIARIGSRTQGSVENWKALKRVVDRVVEVYSHTSLVHGSTINDYFRADLTRCYRLTTRWGWWRCESILGVFFDFFARRGLAQLHKEDSRGSPKFLESLNMQPSLEVQPDDRSFAIFLKFLASGLHGMRKHSVCSEKKIAGIAWRFIPNHGRSYPKDSEVRQDDLDALRNHHDLLCTLYYATPPAHRLRVELIQQLVDHSTSHREACRLNVRAWANLATFQASTDEGVGKLHPFALWYKDMLNATLSQYRLARVEAEQAAVSAKASNNTAISQAIIDDTIHRNQRMIVATLVDMLAAMKRALQSSRTLAVAIHILESTTFWKVFEIFEPSSRRLYSLLNEALEVFKVALKMQTKLTASAETQSSNEDSQDYGDFTDLQEFAGTRVTACRTIVDVLRAPLAQLVSDIFGADASTEDSLMVNIIDVWSSIAHLMIKAGKKSLNNYLNDYDSEAWVQLRDTDHKRRFTPYFLSCIMDIDDINFMETGILRQWLTSLGEREALLKYQHVFTSKLLNRWKTAPILENLPFTWSPTAGYAITLQEFRQRRLSLVTSVLSNMQKDFEQVVHERPTQLPEVRRMYADLLKHLMQAMKQNYQELQASYSGDTANAEVQGAYVQFVQHVVSSMQQYTTDICPIDRFFTDSSAFPLPATDPTYVVGRLRSYVAKLSEDRKRKELAVFIQTVSERAAVDNQQTYLVDQLVSAMTGVRERGSAAAPSLRHVLFTSIFPAYIERALSTSCAWIVARPIMMACGPIAADLLYHTTMKEKSSVSSSIAILHSLLRSMASAMATAMAHPGQLRQPHVQSILTTTFNNAQQCLTSVHFFTSSLDSRRTLRDLLDSYVKAAQDITTYLDEEDGCDFVNVPDPAPETACPWPDTREFSRKQIRDKLRNDWSTVDGQYFLRRGTTSVEVTAPLRDEEDERRDLLESVRAFQESFETIFNARSIIRHEREAFSDLIV